jgi:hypothetical protein
MRQQWTFAPSLTMHEIDAGMVGYWVRRAGDAEPPAVLRAGTAMITPGCSFESGHNARDVLFIGLPWLGPGRDGLGLLGVWFPVSYPGCAAAGSG